MALYFSEYRARFGDDMFFYGNASHALYEVLVWLQENRPKAKPNIVLPVFIPAKLYRIVLAAGYEPRFFDISLNCQMNVDEVKSLIDDQTQTVLYIHYFGIPALIEDLKSYTSLRNVFLIEDCAHTLNSRWKGAELGGVGDCAIFSSRKMLQLPAGGFLVFNKIPWNFTPGYSKRVRSIFTAYKMIQLRLKYAYFNLTRGRDPLNVAWIPNTGYINFAEKHRVCVKQISWLNKMYMHAVDLEKITLIRRANYEYLLNGLKNLLFVKSVPVSGETLGMVRQKGNKLFLQEGITPYSFPVLVPSGTRDMLLNLLCEAGVGCGAGWPESPFGHNGFNQAAELSDRLLEFPIHQGLNKFQLDQIINCVHSCQQTEISFSIQKKSKKAEVA